MNNKCYDCIYRGTVPGDTHSCCNYPGNDTGPLGIFNQSNRDNLIKLNIKAERYGVLSGWFTWPINFDPVWLTNCDGFKEKTKEITNGKTEGI